MTPQPNPAPTSAPFRLVPREPCLAVFPHEFPRGIKPGRAGAEGAPAVPFFDAFLRHWPTDAFAVPYLTDFPPDDVPPEGLQPRRCMSDLEDCYSRSLWLDWDTERKTWTDEQRADSAAVFAAIEAERAAIDAAVGAALLVQRLRRAKTGEKGGGGG